MLHCLRLRVTLAVALVLVFSCALGSSAEARSVAPLSPRKPPFNGSIFGKRSVYSGPPLAPPEVASDYTSSTQLAYLFRQQESLMQAFASYCRQSRRASDSVFCMELAGQPVATIEQAPAAEGGWLYQVSSLS